MNFGGPPLNQNGALRLSRMPLYFEAGSGITNGTCACGVAPRNVAVWNERLLNVTLSPARTCSFVGRNWFRNGTDAFKSAGGFVGASAQTTQLRACAGPAAASAVPTSASTKSLRIPTSFDRARHGTRDPLEGDSGWGDPGA